MRRCGEVDGEEEEMVERREKLKVGCGNLLSLAKAERRRRRRGGGVWGT